MSTSDSIQGESNVKDGIRINFAIDPTKEPGSAGRHTHVMLLDHETNDELLWANSSTKCPYAKGSPPWVELDIDTLAQIGGILRNQNRRLVELKREIFDKLFFVIQENMVRVVSASNEVNTKLSQVLTNQSKIEELTKAMSEKSNQS